MTEKIRLLKPEEFMIAKAKVEYENTLQLLEDLQTYLDNTETPSEALDSLYTHIINTRRAIIHEMEEENE
jgi:hypothetical protein